MNRKLYKIILVVGCLLGGLILFYSNRFQNNFYHEIDIVVKKNIPQVLEINKLTSFEWDSLMVIKTGDSVAPTEEEIHKILGNHIPKEKIGSLRLDQIYFYFLTPEKELIIERLSLPFSVGRNYSLNLSYCAGFWIPQKDANFIIKTTKSINRKTVKLSLK